MSGSWSMPRSVGHGGTSDHVALGRAVRELRKRRGVTQHLVALDAGVQVNTVGNVERGVVNPTFGVLLRIVRTLGSDLDELVEIYRRHLAEIDPHAGRDVPLCPTPEAKAHVEQQNDRDYQRHLRAIVRGRMKSWT
jgi:transcriptional regulator with XRE-family HTH domain